MMGRGFGYGYHMLGPGYGHGFGVFGPILGVLFIAAVVVLVIVGLRAARHGGHRAAQQGQYSVGSTPGAPFVGPAAPLDEAVAIAKRRLASGEIDPAQYDEIIAKLQG